MVGQQRSVAGLAGIAVTGWDFCAGLEMARALSLNLLFVAEMLPIFERIAVKKHHEQREARAND